jgi:hypothetical protein
MTKQNAYMIRKEEAVKQEAKTKRWLKLDEYKIDGDDVILLTGPYAGKSVKYLWSLGPAQRDYVFKNLYKRGDAELMEIIKALFCD